MIPRLYEDNHLLVVVKPPMMPVQADESGDEDLLTLLKREIKEQYGKPGNVYLGLVHRLDRPVGGVMVFAKTSKAAARLSEAIRENRFGKEYLCIAEGRPEEGCYEDWLLKDSGTHGSTVVPRGTPGAREARLECRILDQQQGLTLCAVRLITGRNHQIRVQFASRSHPLWGDARYNPGARPGEPIALFCTSLSFPHPVGGAEMTFSAFPDGKIWKKFRIEGKTASVPAGCSARETDC